MLSSPTNVDCCNGLEELALASILIADFTKTITSLFLSEGIVGCKGQFSAKIAWWVNHRWFCWSHIDIYHLPPIFLIYPDESTVDWPVELNGQSKIGKFCMRNIDKMTILTCLSNLSDHCVWFGKISPVGIMELGTTIGASTGEKHAVWLRLTEVEFTNISSLPCSFLTSSHTA